ncbi:hypothetical protein EDD36DRAFT_461902 [Exophiala viscosa]|uniref:Uncharacterized protein n=1 Tax=Exophiala viscosa TaxID=2486360 RepID=A0AAN6E2M3_9EURO|nr:hypothetical protein EDD36DRAFT_461902 [Exophiala viscosa]
MLVQVLSHGSREQVDGAVDILRMRRGCEDILDDFMGITTSLQKMQPCLLPESARGLVESDTSLEDPPAASVRFSSRKPQIERTILPREEQGQHRQQLEEELSQIRKHRCCSTCTRASLRETEPKSPLQDFEHTQEEYTTISEHHHRHSRLTSKDPYTTGDCSSPSSTISVLSPSNFPSNETRYDRHSSSQNMDVSFVSGSEEVMAVSPVEESRGQSVVLGGLPATFDVNIDERIPGSWGHNHCSPYSIPTLITQEETPLSNVITKYRNSASGLLAHGASPIDILGDVVIDVELFFRDRMVTDISSVCNWASEVWRSFNDWDFYVRLAHILAYTAIMRWQLCSTQEYYVAIPDMLKPRAVQYSVPHDIALDFMPLPPLRENLIKKAGDWVTVITSAGLSVNWDRGMDEAVVRNSSSQRRQLSKDFIRHVVNYQNWSVGESILTIFPEMLHSIRFHRMDPGSK